MLLCDLSLMTAATLASSMGNRPVRILFDREGVLEAAQNAARAPAYSPHQLLPTIHEYWVYGYLNGKYWKRSDIDKLLYVQGVLFQTHMRLLRAFHPGVEWAWWPASIHHLTDEHQAAMRLYFSAADLTAIPAALKREFDLFSRDARSAARAWDVAYPDSLERSVRRHLHEMGLAIA